MAVAELVAGEAAVASQGLAAVVGVERIVGGLAVVDQAHVVVDLERGDTLAELVHGEHHHGELRLRDLRLLAGGGLIFLAEAASGEKEDAGEDNARQKSRHTPAFGAKSAELKPPNEAFGWVADSPGRVRHISNIGHGGSPWASGQSLALIPVGETVRR